MTKQMRDLLQDLFAGDVAAEEARLAALDAYVAAELAGQDAAALYPDVQAQIAADPDAAAHVSALRDLYSTPVDELEAPPRSATFRLAPLVAESAPAANPDWLLEAGTLIVHFSQQVLDALRPAPTLAPAFLKANSTQLLLQWELHQLDDDFGLDLAALAEDDQGRCRLVVAVDVPSRGGWPNLAGIPVTLTLQDERRQEATTDAFGKVTFAGVPTAQLPTLRLDVALSQP